MTDKFKNKIITVTTVLIIALLGLAWYQDHTLSKMRNLLEQTDTLTIVETDTIWRDTTIVDSVPKYIHQLILKTDTVYKMNEDSTISMTPILIALKKKKYQIQL